MSAEQADAGKAARSIESEKNARPARPAARLSARHEKHQAKIKEFRAYYPQQYCNLYDRACAGKSRKAAVRAFCVQCMGYQPGEVEKCTAPACPLWLYRIQG